MMSWKSLPIDLEQSTEHPERLRLTCRFCEMFWIGEVNAKEALVHVTTFHPDQPWCGHKNFANGHCAVISCHNYYAKHWEMEN